jgi:hypothetical protein
MKLLNIVPALLFFFCFESYSQTTCADFNATDALGRKLPVYEEVGDQRAGKFVGLFYWTWHTELSKGNAPYNTTEYLSRDPGAKEDYLNPIWPKKNSPWFWSEPLFGYYLNTDEWVLRKHAEMLADAAIDVIVFDCTNGNFTWQQSYMKLCEVFSRARRDGVRTPQIAFMLPFSHTPGSREIITELYNNLYSKGLYKDLWFNWKGKPLIMAYPGSAGGSKKILDFFTFRPGQPVYDKGPERKDHWGWLEIYPQHGFVKTDNGYEQAVVGVAQNWSKEKGLTAMNTPGSFGRSYTAKKGQVTISGAVNYGYNFQEQWDKALEIDPEFIFITGWNEWIAGRHELWQQQTNAFPDEFDQEGSRDIEMMKGGHGDNYYYQMMGNIRKFKGMAKPPKVSVPHTVSIDGNFQEWENVSPKYCSPKGNTIHRNSLGWGGLHYINTSGRNDIVALKVARDKDNLYFYAETARPLSPKTDSAWMRIFIDIDLDKNTGWEGYDFVINRRSPGKKAHLEKTDFAWNWKPAGELEYAVKKNQIEIKVPRVLLGVKAVLNFGFKCQDNTKSDNDIMDFWINGDAAPAGRAYYHYKSGS